MRKNKSHQDNLPNYYLIVDLMNFPPSPRKLQELSFLQKWDAPGWFLKLFQYIGVLGLLVQVGV